jgi:hypothetical protein
MGDIPLTAVLSKDITALEIRGSRAMAYKRYTLLSTRI